jgi:hypothetical protein
MVTAGEIVSGLISSFVFIFTCVALGMTYKDSVFAACGHTMWDLTISLFFLRLLIIPLALACIILPVLYVKHSGVQASRAVFIGTLVTGLCMMGAIFGTEVYYTADTLANAACTAALKNATHTDVELLTTAAIMFTIYDGLLLIIILVMLTCTSCIFQAMQRAEPEQAPAPSSLLNVRIF